MLAVVTVSHNEQHDDDSNLMLAVVTVSHNEQHDDDVDGSADGGWVMLDATMISVCKHGVVAVHWSRTLGSWINETMQEDMQLPVVMMICDCYLH